MIFKYRCQN